MKSKMNITPANAKRSGTRLFLSVTTLALSFFLLILAAPSVRSQGQRAGTGRLFATPEAAAEALTAAAEKYDVEELKGILGPDSYDVVSSGEPVADREVATEFAAKARQKTVISRDPRYPGRVFMTVGDNSWPFPIPMVKKGSQWYFDTKTGRQEILYRRIGGNELDAIEICRGFVEAQKTYALTKHEGSTVNQYAQRIISAPGKQDGLAWQNPDGTWGGAITQKAALAIEKNYTGQVAPFHGYYFKVLKGQGSSAWLGRLDYVINGAMIGGFALLAYPAQYRVTGVKSFMINQEGVVYEKDLGTDTLGVARSIELFDPGLSWKPVTEQ
jgi:hypothetical protein